MLRRKIYASGSTVFSETQGKSSGPDPTRISGIPCRYVLRTGGLLGAVGWYKWEYTIKHPFLSAMLGIFGPWIAVAAVMNLAGK